MIALPRLVYYMLVGTIVGITWLYLVTLAVMSIFSIPPVEGVFQTMKEAGLVALGNLVGLLASPRDSASERDYGNGVVKTAALIGMGMFIGSWFTIGASASFALCEKVLHSLKFLS